MADADGALRVLVTLAVAVIALAFPFVASGYHIYQGSQVLILAIALLGLNLLTGFNGQISLGHGAFFAIGGYGAAILITKFGLPFWAAIPLASVVCFVAGFLFGFPALRFGGLYLALATFALAVATPQILSYTGFDAFTGGSQGLSLPKPLAPLGLSFNPDQWLYLVCLACGAALYWAARNLARGRIGRALIAIRDQPIAAETMGVNAALYKTTCFGVSALYAGVAGGLSAIAVGFVSPESFGLALSLAFVVGIVVGALLGGGEGEHFDLVELVDAEDPARVLAGGASLAAKARREARIAQRQSVRAQDLACVQRRKRHLRGPEEIEIVLGQAVDLLLGVGQHSGAVERVRANQHGRNHRLEAGADQLLECPAHQRELEQHEIAAQVGKAGARQAGPGFHVNHRAGELEVVERRAGDPRLADSP